MGDMGSVNNFKFPFNIFIYWSKGKINFRQYKATFYNIYKNKINLCLTTLPRNQH